MNHDEAHQQEQDARRYLDLEQWLDEVNPFEQYALALDEYYKEQHHAVE